MTKWEVTYTHDRALPGQEYSFVVEADDEDTAKMRAGMMRAESWVAWFLKEFYAPEPVRWERVSIRRL